MSALPPEFLANTDSFIGAEQLAERLASGKPLRVKLGVDPTRPDLTFGHMVVFNKLRQFQELGHQAVLVIGDFTTLIGDPSGRSSTRPVLTREEIETNAATYLDQAFKVLDRSKTEVRRNSEWFSRMGFEGALGLARKMTVARMLERDDFAKRYADNTPISIVEFLYPLLQGWDSVELKADVELGGRDQLFNLLVGRQLLKDAGMFEQACVTLPLLVGLDGENKMSKSLGNYIAFNDTPKDMFGKIMSVSDLVMWDYYRLLLLASDGEIATRQAGHPMAAKKNLAAALVDKLHGEGAGARELANFEQVFSRHELPAEMPEFAWSALVPAGVDREKIANLLVAAKLSPSKNEARRLLEQGAVQVNQQKVSGPHAELEKPATPVVLQAGKRHFCRILPG